MSHSVSSLVPVDRGRVHGRPELLTIRHRTMTCERRENHRLPIQGSTVQSAMMQGRILNLSLNGLAIETSDGLHIGRKHRLRMKLEDRILVFEATVRWCRLKRIHSRLDGDRVPIYRAGLEIDLPSSSSPHTVGPNWICRPSM